MAARTDGGLLDTPVPVASPAPTSNIATAHAYKPPIILTAELLESLPTPLQPFREIIGLAIARELPDRERKWRSYETRQMRVSDGKFVEVPESTGFQTEEPNELIQIAVKGWLLARDMVRTEQGDAQEWKRLGHQHLATLTYWQNELTVQYGASIPAAVALLKSYKAGAKERINRPKPRAELAAR